MDTTRISYGGTGRMATAVDLGIHVPATPVETSSRSSIRSRTWRDASGGDGRNVDDYGIGHIARFAVRTDFLSAYDIH